MTLRRAAVALLAAVFSTAAWAGPAKPHQAAASADTGESVALTRPNTINLELLGRGGLYSLNFDHQFSEDFAFGGGASVLPVTGATIFFVPVYANYYFSHGNSRFFATGGLDVVFFSGTASSGYGSFTGGGVGFVFGPGFEYRGDGGFLFRITFPYITIGNSVGLTGGLTFGYAF
ncbi:MAG TPA: hypothetical protein VL588_07170 [Bdellovibrionota bacterium]|jgi:hypothetical protein|nr:hypothetical protein [Bdellovibrionota bacterium]